MLILLKVHYFKIKSQKEATKYLKSRLCGFMLIEERILIQIQIWIRTNNDGTRSGRPKNIRIRIHNTGFSVFRIRLHRGSALLDPDQRVA
jgi:hypothetical protein